MPGDIRCAGAIVEGRVTYHGGGQQVMRLLNLKRRKLGVRDLVTYEQTVVNTLAEMGIEAHPRADAPGVYVGEKENLLAGFTYPSRLLIPRFLALETLTWILSPFLRINPWLCRHGEMAKITQWKVYHG